MKRIINFLVDNFEVSEGEAQVYIKLLKLQSSTVLELSKSTGINRITVHGYVDKLVEKGLISQTRRGSRRQLVPEPPAKLQQLFENRKKAFLKAEERLPTVISDIKKKVPDTPPIKTEIKYYTGKNEVELLVKNAFKTDQVFGYLGTNSNNKSLDFGDIAIKSIKKKSFDNLTAILEDNPTSRKFQVKLPENKVNLEYLPKERSLHSVHRLMFDNKVAVINTGEKYSGFLISDSQYFMSEKSIFDLVWDNIVSNKS